MSSGTIMDPNKCTEAKLDLLFSASLNSVEGSFASDLMSGEKATFFDGLMLPGIASAVYFNHLTGRPMWIGSALKNVWRDCDGGGWLKKNLDSAKSKIQSGIEKAKLLVPQPTPELVPIPISSYAASAEASYRRATSFGSISKGVVVALEAGALTLVGMALARFMPTVGATAGFGFTTDESPFISTQIQIL